MMIGVPMPEAKSPKPVEFRPRPEKIRDLIRRLAADTGKIFWTPHAHERMAERDITDRTAVDVLRTGSLRGLIEPGKHPGEWEVKMVKEVKGRREAGVVVLTIRDERLLVKTVEWEDVK
jgi:hypothetical protein